MKHCFLIALLSGDPIRPAQAGYAVYPKIKGLLGILLLGGLLWCTPNGNTGSHDARVNSSSLSQDSVVKPAMHALPPAFQRVRPHFHPQKGYDRVEFWDELEGLVKTLDLKAMDPFAPIVNACTGADTMPIAQRYTLTLAGREALRRYTTSTVVKEALAGGGPLWISWMPVLDDSEFACQHFNYVGISYKLYLFGEWSCVAILEENLVFDTKGELVASISNDQGGYPHPAVTNDGRWMVIKYGDRFSAEDKLPEGLIFYDLTTGAVAYRDTVKEDAWSYHFPIHDYIVSIENLYQGERLSVYDLDKGLKYVRLCDSKSGRPGIIIKDDFDIDGFYVSFYIVDGQKYQHGEFRKKVYFEKDFQIVHLSNAR